LELEFHRGGGHSGRPADVISRVQIGEDGVDVERRDEEVEEDIDELGGFCFDLGNE
jgi:hypothetical protein